MTLQIASNGTSIDIPANMRNPQGNRNLFVEIGVEIAEIIDFTLVSGVQGRADRGFPDFGYVSFEFRFQGRRMYGQPIPVQMSTQLIMPDTQDLQRQVLLLVPRQGVTFNVDIFED